MTSADVGHGSDVLMARASIVRDRKYARWRRRRRSDEGKFSKRAYTHTHTHALRRRPEAREVRARETESKIISGSAEIKTGPTSGWRRRTRAKRASPRHTDVSLEAWVIIIIIIIILPSSASSRQLRI